LPCTAVNNFMGIFALGSGTFANCAPHRLLLDESWARLEIPSEIGHYITSPRSLSSAISISKHYKLYRVNFNPPTRL